MLSEETYLVNAEVQTWLAFTEGPAVSFRFGWYHTHFHLLLLQWKCCLMKMPLLLNLAGGRAAKWWRKHRRERHADKCRRDKHCPVVASGPAYHTFVDFLNSLWGSGKRMLALVLPSVWRKVKDSSLLPPLRMGKCLPRSSDALQWIHGSVQGICVVWE